jgi:hypothetical protein
LIAMYFVFLFPFKLIFFKYCPLSFCFIYFSYSIQF